MWFTWIATAIAAALFIPLFITRGVAWLDFWWWMAANIAILLTGVAVFDKGWRNEVVGDFAFCRQPFYMVCSMWEILPLGICSHLPTVE
jgi:hypothetical protein